MLVLVELYMLAMLLLLLLLRLEQLLLLKVVVGSELSHRLSRHQPLLHTGWGGRRRLRPVNSSNIKNGVHGVQIQTLMFTLLLLFSSLHCKKSKS